MEVPPEWNSHLIVCVSCYRVLFLQAAHQLRFLREWAVFGRTLRRSVWEIVSVALALLLLLMAYSHTGYLVSIRAHTHAQISKDKQIHTYTKHGNYTIHIRNIMKCGFSNAHTASLTRAKIVVV